MRSFSFLHSFLLSVLAVAILASSANAAPIFDYFGPLDEATFGGTGIPNQEVAVASQFVDGNVEITVAMSATQRFSNPALTNDGAGTYFAGTGSNFGGNGESTTEGAIWNFNYFMRVVGLNGATPILADYQFNLFYDFDPGADTPIGALGVIDITASVLAGPDPAATLVEDSQNLLFGFLAADIPGFLSAPGGAFDPNIVGEYNFGIQVSRAGWGIETVAMDVQAVPEPGTALLFGLGLAGLAARTDRKRLN